MVARHMFWEKHALKNHLDCCTARSLVLKKDADFDMFVARPSSSGQHCAEACTGRLLAEYPEWGTNFLWDCAGLGTLAEGGG